MSNLFIAVCSTYCYCQAPPADLQSLGFDTSGGVLFLSESDQDCRCELTNILIWYTHTHKRHGRRIKYQFKLHLSLGNSFLRLKRKQTNPHSLIKDCRKTMKRFAYTHGVGAAMQPVVFHFKHRNHHCILYFWKKKKDRFYCLCLCSTRGFASSKKKKK